jgi:tetratricopeptide (TPR) repeat protein
MSLKQPRIALGAGPLVLSLFLAAGAVTMLFTSIQYRLERPSMTMSLKKSESRGPMGSEAMERLSKLMVQARDNPNDLDTLLELGRLFFGMGSYDNAKTFLARAVEIAPQDDATLRLYGMALFHARDYPAAAKIFEKIIAANPSDAVAYFNLGVLQKHFLEKPEEAEKNFKQAFELAPGDQELRNRVREELGSK